MATKDRATVSRCTGDAAVIAGRAAIWRKADKVTATMALMAPARTETERL
jgi:hypothetical protein